MAEAIAIIGTAGAVTNIIDLLGKTIATVYGFQQQCKDADFALLGLLAQLRGLRLVLSKIKEWADADFDDPYHRLRMDLDALITHCRVLISRIDDKISDLGSKQNGSLKMSSRIQLVFGREEIEALQKTIDRDISILGVLLLACNCKSISDQKALVDKPSTRKTMSLVREDTASIMESRDESSVISRWSTRTTKLSRAFDFDRELLFTRVYERAMRLAYTQTLWPRQDEELTISAMPQGSTREPPVIKAMQDPAAKGRSQLIDQQLVKDGNALRRECKVLVLGDRDSGKDAVVTQIRMASQEGFSTEELASSRLLVLAEVVRAAKELVSMMNSDGIEPDIVESIHHRDLIQNLNWDGQGSLGADFAVAVGGLWQDKGLAKLKVCFSGTTQCLFESIVRISSEHYVPTEIDVLRTTQMSETRIQRGRMIYRLILTDLRLPGKLVHYFEEVTAIIFVVDIATYDQAFEDSPKDNKLLDAIALFDSIVNSRWFMRSSAILLLTNVSRFGDKLSRVPLASHFPGYSGGNDITRAAKYILERFQQVIRAPIDLYPCLAETTDPALMTYLFSTIKGSIVSNSLKAFGFL